MSSSESLCRYPHVGQIVTFHAPQSDSSVHHNGSLIHPAMITRVWGPDCVNVKIFPDCGPVRDETSVPRAFHGGNSWGFSE